MIWKRESSMDPGDLELPAEQQGRRGEVWSEGACKGSVGSTNGQRT